MVGPPPCSHFIKGTTFLGEVAWYKQKNHDLSELEADTSAFKAQAGMSYLRHTVPQFFLPVKGASSPFVMGLLLAHGLPCRKRLLNPSSPASQSTRCWAGLCWSLHVTIGPHEEDVFMFTLLTD